MRFSYSTNLAYLLYTQGCTYNLATVRPSICSNLPGMYHLCTSRLRVRVTLTLHVVSSKRTSPLLDWVLSNCRMQTVKYSQISPRFDSILHPNDSLLGVVPKSHDGDVDIHHVINAATSNSQCFFVLLSHELYGPSRQFRTPQRYV